MSYTGRFWMKSFLFFLVLSSLALLFYFTKHKMRENGWDAKEEGLKNGIIIKVTDACDYLIQFYGIPIVETAISFLYSLYISVPLLNLVVLLVKYVPTGFYTYKMVKNFYVTSRERIMKTKMELEDIQLQIQIVNTKLSVRDAEFTERTELLKRETERLRTLRARVRELIATDETLKRTLDRAAPSGDDPVLGNTASDEEREYIIELLKELKNNQKPASDGQSMNMDCGEQVPTTEVPTDENTNSIYSSVSEDVKPECTVKIVRVTNVYKVAYLKHYIKQKKLRRATKHAMLKKKIEAIKTLLEDWQKSLNRVINIKLPISQSMTMDAASEEAMGDYSKPNLRELSDSETDLMTNGTNAYFDEINFNWTQNPYRPYQYEGLQEISVKELYEPEYNENSRYAAPHAPHLCECKTRLFMLPEETSSQVAIEEVKSEHDSDFENDGRDMVAL